MVLEINFLLLSKHFGGLSSFFSPLNSNWRHFCRKNKITVIFGSKVFQSSKTVKFGSRIVYTRLRKNLRECQCFYSALERFSFIGTDRYYCIVLFCVASVFLHTIANLFAYVSCIFIFVYLLHPSDETQ